MAIKSFNITVCASGGGGNFRSLAKHQFDCGYRISLLVVDRECFAIDVAKEYGIPYTVLYRKFLNKSFFEEFEKVIPVDTSLIVKSGSVESSIFILHYCQNMEERVCME